MKYTINHVCGHTSVVNLYGSSSERQRRIEYLSSKQCEQCCAKTMSDAAGRLGLPQLHGSDKQVAWALRIREAMLGEPFYGRTVKDCVAEYIDMTVDQQQQVEQAAKTNAEIAKIYNVATVSSAAWYIDNRDIYKL